nr:helix-turn-helix domain-containing protein [Flexivirga meconopsidis]
MELFLEQGYDRTSVTEIAQRAGLTKRTFFRYFGDKREVIFAERDLLGDAMTAAIAAAPAGTTAWQTALLAVEAVAEIFPDERRAFVRTRGAAVGSAPELLERDLLKRQALTDRVTDAVRRRGIPASSAVTVATLTVLCLRNSLAAWATGDSDFGAAARKQHRQLSDLLADGLTQPLPSSPSAPDIKE